MRSSYVHFLIFQSVVQNLMTTMLPAFPKCATRIDKILLSPTQMVYLTEAWEHTHHAQMTIHVFNLKTNKTKHCSLSTGTRLIESSHKISQDTKP